MMLRLNSVPTGYIRLRLAGAEIVAQAALADALGRVVDGGTQTLYGYAQQHPQSRPLVGRLPAFAVPLPDGLTHVVVRHSHHGGTLARLTGDRFLAPTRAPRELATSLRLAAGGVRTPELIGYVCYPAGPFLRRSDVATREIANGQDLGEALLAASNATSIRMLLDPVFELLGGLGRMGARHPDLVVKNILLAACAGTPRAYVLDVDRVWFGTPGDRRIADANLCRLLQSVRKWRATRGARLDDLDLAWLERVAREQLP